MPNAAASAAIALAVAGSIAIFVYGMPVKLALASAGYGAAFGLLGMQVVVGGCDEAPVPVRIGSNLWPGYEPLYVLRERGMLPPGLRLVELVSASQVMRGIRNGLLDGGGLTLDEALRLGDRIGGGLWRQLDVGRWRQRGAGQ
jgi:hypothetical protein